LSFRSNLSYTTLLASARERAAELTSQTMSLRGRAAAGAIGAAAIGVMTLGSAAGALAASGPADVTTTAAVAGQAVGAGKAGAGAAVDPEQVAHKGDRKGADRDFTGKKESRGKQEFAGKRANSAEASTDKSATAKDVIKLAEKQIGIREGKDGNTKFNKWYVKSDTAKRTAERDGGKVSDYNGVSWCDMFVSWIGEKANVKGIGADAYTVSHAKWFKDHDQWGKKARPGAVVFFAWDGSKSIGAIEHVGFVVKDNHDGTITTIEGNTDNSVDKKIRPKSEVAGYGYPDYRK
jgi:uncharacterized protein (TIGR02594 family)